MTNLEHALAYAKAGLEVFPGNPRTKAPLTKNGMKDASADTAQIVAWWTRHPDALICCRVPPDVVILDVDPRHDGHLTWQRLKAKVLPDGFVTRVSMSGRGDGGGHVWFRRPAGKLTEKNLPGIDVLHHDHRYTILPPSLHPDSGQPYTWHGDGLDVPVIDLPALHPIILDVSPAPAPPLPQAAPSDSIAEWFEAHHSWRDILEPHGWQVARGDGDQPGSLWRHPNASREHTHSASIDEHGNLHVYSGNTPFPVSESGAPAGQKKFRAWAVLEHNGDLKAAAREAFERRDGPAPDWRDWRDRVRTDTPISDAEEGNDNTEPERTGWEEVDLAPVLDDDYQTPKPTIGQRKDGIGLFYEREINTLMGDSGGGKSWIAQFVVAQQLTAGNHVTYIDYEDHEGKIVARLRALGVAAHVVRGHFHYIKPGVKFGPEARALVTSTLAERGDSLVVIDSTGESMGLEALDQNDDRQVVEWFNRLPRVLSKLGITVLLIDHVPKANDTLFAIGSQRKRAAPGGTVFLCEQSDTRPLGLGLDGWVSLTTAKDRNGFYAQGSRAADFNLWSDDAGTTSTARLFPPKPKPDLKIVVWRFVADHPDISWTELVEGLADDEGLDERTVKAIMRTLEREGSVQVLRQTRPYRCVCLVNPPPFADQL